MKALFKSTLIISLLLIQSAANAQDSKPAAQSVAVNMKIEAPDDWTTETRTQPGPDGVMRTVYVLQGPKEATGQSYISVVISNYNSPTQEAYINNLLNSYAMTFIEFNLDRKEEVFIDGKSFASFYIDHKLKDVEYTMRTVVAFYDDLVYQINAIAEREHFKKDDKVIDMIIKSIKFQ